MQALILTLDDTLTSDVAGTKAATLARLRRAGLPVPPGFCLIAAAFRAAVASSPADALMPKDLETEVAQAYQDLGEGPVAVRSSAVGEDLAGASFAGQYETFLNVEGVADLVRAVKDCWASATTSRAQAYQRQHGGGDAAMGVLVQRMVPAEAAGVMFTRDPAGDRANLIIEAAHGLGDAVVSARVTPDRYRIRRESLKIIAQEVGDPNGNREDAAAAPLLGPKEIRALAALGLQIEELLGGPRDIEWAWAGGRPYIMQARPITALGDPPCGEEVSFENAKPHDLWSRANVGEVFPGVLSPLAWSGIRVAFQDYFRQLTDRTGMRPEDAGDIFGLFSGRLYTNIGTIHHLVTEVLGFSSDYFEMSIGGPGRAEGLPLPHRPMRWRKLLAHAPAILRYLRENDNFPDRAAAVLAEAAAWDQRYRDADFPSWTLEDLARANRELASFLGPQWVFHTQASGAAMSAFGMLAELLHHWLGDRAVTNDLITGMATLKTAEISGPLWAIARRAAADPLLRASIAAAGASQLPGVLRASLQGRARWEELQEFLKEYGHRANNELDSLEPRWVDNPRPIFAILKGYLLADPAQDPGGYEDRQRRRRDDAEREVVRHLSAHPLDRLFPVRRAVFRSLLDRARRLLPLRENIKHELLRAGLHQRRALLALGQRFVELGLLGVPEDIFFLEVGEIEALAAAPRKAALATRLRRRVQRRRQERARYLAIEPPEILVPGQPVVMGPSPVGVAHARVLTGLAASSGRVTGPARVLTDPTQADQLRPGEVLVAPFTDPGWTPVFPLVAAIVMDLGGLLSHGAIIAREYGIPAIVNVRTGTRRIRTGQIVTVDGTRGTVTLEGE